MNINNVRNQGFLALTLANEEHLEPFSLILNNGTHVDIWDTGIISFTPKNGGNTGKDIILSSGVHGNETAPIEILDRIISLLLDENITVTNRTLFIFANPHAININKRFVEENLNRLFSGIHAMGNKKNQERKRASLLEMYVTRFFGQGSYLGKRKRVHYDLHTTIRQSNHEKFAVLPWCHGKPYGEELINFITACGATAILLYHKPASTFSYFSSSLFGADAATIELGKVRPFGENKKEDFQMAEETIIQLVSNTPALSLQELPFPEIFKVRQHIIRTQKDFYFTFDNDIKNFTPFPANTILGYDGTTPFKTSEEGEVIVFPLATVAIGQGALLTATPCKLKPEEAC